MSKKQDKPDSLRKAAEDAVKEQSQINELILQSSMDGIILADDKGRIVNVNPSYCEIVGYSHEELLDMNIVQLEAKLTPEQVGEKIEAMMRDGSARFESQHRCKNGSLIDLDVSIFVIRPEGGTPLVCAFVHDITKRKRTEEQLQLTQFVSDHAPNSIVWINSQGRICYANEAACRAHGYTREELLAMTIHDLDPDYPAEVWPDHWRELQQADILTFESRHRRKDGSIFPIEVTTNYISFGGKEFNVGYSRDISAHKQRENMLRESEEHFRTLTAQSPNMIFINQRGRIVFANEQCEKIMGYSIAEFYSPNFDFRRLIAPEDKNRINDLFNLHMQSKHIPAYECALITKYGKRLDTIHTTKLIKFNNEQAILGIITDITERVTSNKKLNALNADLSATLQAIPDLLFELNQNGKYIQVWARNPDLLAAQQSVVLGRNVSEVLPPASANIVMAALSEAEENGYSHGQVIELDLPAGKSWFELSTSLKSSTKDDDKRFIMLSRDITNRKKMEAALVAAKQRTEIALEGSKISVWESNIGNNTLLLDDT